MSYSSNIPLSRDQYYDLLVKKAQTLRRVPTFDEVNADEDMPNANSYAYHFKSFDKAIEQLKLDIKRGKVSGVVLEGVSDTRVLPVASKPKINEERPKEDAQVIAEDKPKPLPVWTKGLSEERIQLINELVAFTEKYHRLPVFNPSKKVNDGRSLPHSLNYYRNAFFGDWDYAMELVLKVTDSEVVQGRLVKKGKRGDDMKKDKDTDVDLLRSMVRVFYMHNVMPNVSNWSRYKNELKYGYQTYVKRLGYGAYETLKNMALEASRINSPTDEQLEELIKKWRDVAAIPNGAANSEIVQEDPDNIEEIDSEEILEDNEYEEDPESFSVEADDIELEPEGSEEVSSDDENGLDDDTGEVDDSDDSDSSDDVSEASEDDFEGERAESEYSEDTDEPEVDGSSEESDNNEEESDESESDEDTVIFSQSLQGACFENKDESDSKFVQDMQIGGFTLHYEYDKETAKEVLTIDDFADETLYEVIQYLSGIRTTTITR